MARALISVNGIDGSNDNLPVNTVVNLNNDGNGGEVSYSWVILDQPNGPADSLSATNIQAPNFTPQKQGTYFIQLTVNGTLIDTVIVGIRQVKTFQRVPAAGETIQDSSTRGWANASGSFQQLIDAGYGQNFGLMAGVAFGAFSRGTVLIQTGEFVVMPGLPGQEPLPVWSPATQITYGTTLYNSQLAVFESVVSTGSTTSSANDIIYVRLLGLFTDSGVTTGSIGQPIYLDNSNALSTAPGSFPVLIGKSLNVNASADLWIDPLLTSQPLLLTWGNETGPAAGQTRYMNPAGFSPTTVSGNETTLSVPFDGTVARLLVNARVGPSGDSLTFTVRRNFADTAISAVMPDGGGSAADYTNPASFLAFDQLSLSVTAGVLPASAGLGLVATALFFPNKLYL